MTFSDALKRSDCSLPLKHAHGVQVEKKIFWMIFIILGLIADFALPLMWGLLATIPILLISWWIAYKSGWF
jgi:hypothetical protein